MPHDIHGNEIKVGDEVALHCKVLEVTPGTTCNLRTESLGDKKSTHYFTASEVELVGAEHAEMVKMGAPVAAADSVREARAMGLPWTTILALLAQGLPVLIDFLRNRRSPPPTA